MWNLAMCYEHGDGVEKSAAEAIVWHRRAAADGDTDAMCSLGYFYAKGEGVEKDVTTAAKWYRLALPILATRSLCFGWVPATRRAVVWRRMPWRR
jgi:TPR repeat protein